jgi:predicted nucleic acid-binding protein
VKYVVDADVLSEPTKPQPVERVVSWLREHESELAISPIVLGELESGIIMLPDSRRRLRLELWFVNGPRRLRVLNFNAKSATVWAHLLWRLKSSGHTMPIKDSLIAATALAHDLTVATRNTRDFQNAGVKIENPFDP